MDYLISGNSSFMRDLNKANTLDIIRRRGPISQAELAKLLNLQPSTILRIVKDLEADGLIYQSGTGEVSPRGGRKASLWELNPTGAFAIGIDISVQEIVTVLVNFVGHTTDRLVVSCPSDRSASNVMEVVCDCVSQIIERNQTYTDRITGIGVGLPGRVDSTNGVAVYALYFNDWHNVPVVDMLSSKFKLPVYIEGGMQLMALGETWYGAGTDARNILCIGLRQGIGMGVVVDGQIYRGNHQTAGDIGHIIVEPNGIDCHCGRKGCLEATASERAIYEWVKEYVSKNGVAAFNGLISSVSELSMDKFYEAIREGNHLILDRIRESGRIIGRTLCDLVRIFDPDIIIVGGSFADASPVFLESVIESYIREKPNYAIEVPEISASQLKENSVALGAAVLVLSQYFRAIDYNRATNSN